MGLTLTLTDQELPASPAFIEFLYATFKDEDYYAGSWFRQDEESLIRSEERFDNIQDKAHEVVSIEQGKKALIRSYRFFRELLTGDVRTLRDLSKYHFFFIIGIPRTGGTYLTKQLFKAGGIDYTQVQNALAHDGFPHLARFEFKQSGNIHTNGLLQLAEYLTMVELFFGRHGQLKYKSGIVVPKKFTKAVYYFDLIRELFAHNAHFIITLRHPLSITQSVLDKSGGMPEGGKFLVRSAIERWALNDWLHWGVAEEKIMQMDYVEVMLGYWKRFHFQMALAGIPAMPSAIVVPYGAGPMTDVTRQLFSAFGIDMEPEEFKVAPVPEFSEAHEKLARQVITEVDIFWRGLGLDFPADALFDMS